MADLSINLPPNLIDALIQQESSWNAGAYNKKSGATGLGQITVPALTEFNQFNKERYTMADMKDPQKNMRVTHWYVMDRIPQMLQAYKLPVSLDNVLWAYNAGVGRVKNKVMPQETVNYIKNIKGNLFGGQSI